MVPTPDPSNGYEAVAETFARARTPTIGPRVVREWAKRLPPGASILDLGCGPGIPISQTLIDLGFAVYGIDASATLVARFRRSFPNIPVEHNSIEQSDFLGRMFDAVIAWGLMFILPVESQAVLIAKAARVLVPGGNFLFTAPQRPCTWEDGLTGILSTSLGQESYERELSSQGMAAIGNDQDEGENFYYFARKVA
ncbi:MAG TPA: class I SAM-dependent methyltransferase [Bryobacteraceae bacterium]|nr:class I SAM-dependent methyltransferase [Bryobacteraceae bacterium]